MTETGMYSVANMKPVSLMAISTSAVIDGFIARIIINHKFRNTEKVNIEAVYCFPADDYAAVYSLTIRTAAREMKALVEEKERAFDIYDSALENGDSAFRLELEERDIIVLSAGNIFPDEEVTVETEYVTHLESDDGIIKFQIPVALSPRYVPTGSDWAENNIQAPPYQLSVPYGLELYVRIRNLKIKNLKSPSHRIISERDRDEYLIKLQPAVTQPNRDFRLEIEPESRILPVCLVSRHRNGTRSAMVKFMPEFESLPLGNAEGSDVLFILDCSNSMAYSYIEPAKEALELCLRTLNHGDYFNVIVFGSDFESFFDTQLPYCQENLDLALNRLSLTEADMGGSELKHVLYHACNTPPVAGCRREVVLITDGDIYNAREVLTCVYRHHNGARFYTFGIGPAAGRFLLKEMALLTGGVAEMISPGENIQEKVVKQFSRIIQPKIDNIRIKAEQMVIVDGERIPPAFEGDCFTILAEVEMIAPGAKIFISGESSGENFLWECPVTDMGDDDAIPLLWAANELSILEQSLYFCHDEEVLKKIIDLSKKFNLLENHTALVAVDAQNDESKALYYPSFRRIPVMLNCECCDSFNGFPEIMSLVRDREAEYSAIEKNSSGLWYIELLKSQNAQGQFESDDIIARRLGIGSSVLQRHIQNVSGSKYKSLAGQGLLTGLAIRLLAGDPAARKISARAIQKAEKWLDSIGRREEISAFRDELINLLSR